MASRKIKDLTPVCREKFLLFKEKMDAAKIPFIVTCTARITREQIALYAQGRNATGIVNKYREVAGLPPISDEENRRKVTWTLNSKHLVDYDDDRDDNDLSSAFDIAIIKGRKAIWDVKISMNGNDIPDYLEAAMIGESVGLKAGARFRNPDYPHFEV
jgi:hypothetical protein